MIPVWAAFALLVLLDSIPLVILVPLIAARARRAGAPVELHVGAAIFGGLMASLVVQGLLLQALLGGMRPHWLPPIAAEAALVCACGVLASAVGAGAAYFHLCLRTARHPDYDDQPHPLPKDDVPQPGDGDDLLPK